MENRQDLATNFVRDKLLTRTTATLARLNEDIYVPGSDQTLQSSRQRVLLVLFPVAWVSRLVAYALNLAQVRDKAHTVHTIVQLEVNC